MTEAVVLDASVVIGYLTAGDAHGDAAVAILDAEEWVDLIMHPHTLAEVLVLPARHGRTAMALDDLSRIGIGRWQPDEAYPARIATIRADTGLKLADCCPLDAAERLGARLATFDRTLARVARERGVEVVGAVLD